MDSLQTIQELIKIARVEWMFTVGTFSATIITIIAGVITIVWFIRDLRKENSKILKAILDTQQRALETQQRALDVQQQIEKGQREGFAILSQDLKAISEMLTNQTKILEKIHEKLP